MGNTVIVDGKKEHVYWLKTLRTGGACEREISPALTAQTGDTLPTVVEHVIESKVSSTLQARDYKGPSADDFSGGAQKLVLEKSSRVRRLTPLECERLQGFPDKWTEIPYRKKTAENCPTSPRYKALGNSMAVPVMRWIGQRIQQLENLPQKEEQ